MAAKQRFEGLAAALRYHEWALLRDGSYVDLGIIVRRDAALALGASQDGRTTAAIIDTLDDDAAAVRLAAVTALRTRREPIVAAGLARAYLIADVAGDAATQGAALDALLDDPQLTAAPAVRAVIEWDPTRQLDEADGRLLRALAHGGAEAAQLTIAALVDALGDGRWTAQERALQGLVELSPESVPALIEALADPARRTPAALALGRCGDGRALESLIALLDDDNPAVRRAAAETLGDLRDPRAASPLLSAASDESYETRIAAAAALDQLGWAGLLSASGSGRPTVPPGGPQSPILPMSFRSAGAIRDDTVSESDAPASAHPDDALRDPEVPVGANPDDALRDPEVPVGANPDDTVTHPEVFESEPEDFETVTREETVAQPELTPMANNGVEGGVPIPEAATDGALDVERDHHRPGLAARLRALGRWT